MISPEMEGALGADMSRDVQDKMGLYSDEELDAYVKAVGERLVRELGDTPYTFHFSIVDQYEPNAFASLGGYVYVSRGLLAQMNNENELAGVLAHEISHVTQRHHTRQVGRSIGAGIFTLPGRAVGVVSEGLGNLINTPIEAVSQVYLSSYSRGQESEADEYGMSLAARAGYDPAALITALEGIERSVANLTGEMHKASFFDSHPTTTTRVADITKRASGLSIVPKTPIATAYELAQHLDGLWWGPQNPQQGIFQDQVYLNADYDFQLTFPDEWKTLNSPRYIAGSAPDSGAYIALSGDESTKPVTELADAFVLMMREKAALEPTERRSLKVGDWPAQLLRYDDTSGDETVSLYYLFVASDKVTFTVMSMGLEHYRDVLRQTVLSLRRLTPQERDSIGGLRVRLSSVETGDTLVFLSARDGNEWSPEQTSIMNGLPREGGALQPGSLLKVLRRERYIPK